MNRNEKALNAIYENVKYICDQWAHFTSDFENDFETINKKY